MATVNFDSVYADCADLLEDTISTWKPKRVSDVLTVVAEIVDEKLSGNSTVAQIFANSPELWSKIPVPCDGQPLIAVVREVLREELMFRLDVMADGLSIKYKLDWF